MQIHHCRFVSAAELFDGCSRTREVLEQTDVPFVWGGNARSLVAPRSLLDVLVELDADQDQIDMVAARLREVPEDVFVDLEH